MLRHRPMIAAVVLAVALSPTVGVAGLAQAQPPVLPPVPNIDTGSSALLGPHLPHGDAPRLTSVPNFRDVAGTGAGYVGAEGARMAKGVFYRADAIVPDDADLATLDALRLEAIYDLRTDEEVGEKPNRLPAGVDYVRIPILSGNLYEMVDQIGSPEDARNMMREINRAFVTGDVERAAFRDLLTGLATTEGEQVFHCTAGKDRTGWASMLLQSIAGVDDATIMSDYLLTNEYNKEWAAKTRASIAATQGEDVAQLFEPLLGVEGSYLQAGIDELETRYGSVADYLTDGLGLSPDTLAALKDKLLV
ncbi:protein-tyrosine phosphatase [Rhodococcus sp. SMB37]|uniref:tyrosine-protein phosphatase n=1 Tax=Rhodococcus sp. SMB37 TaxID=2512213 RepID=UPI0010495492|nr:tyrosine-protein phosphatase [Rhodococcus sp. SMB37]TCN50912.1 protein-tyrosine phosphatase [Rhodococcus sp. SMB37]